MLNKDQYEILVFVRERDESNPYSAIDVINNFYSENGVPVLDTDKNIEILFHCEYLETRSPVQSKYRTGYGGPIFVSVAGHLAINDYSSYMQQTLVNKKAEKIQKRRFIISTIIGVLTLLAAVLIPLVV